MVKTDLISALDELRVERGWTDAQFAEELEMSRTMWSLMRSGKRMPGRSTLGNIVQRFPHLAPTVTLFLQSDVTHSNDDVTMANSVTS